MNFNFFGLGKIRDLHSISQIEATTKRYMRMNIEQLEQEHRKIMEITKDAEKKSKLVSEIYTVLSRAKQAEIAANSTGVNELATLNQKRLAYVSIKQKLLEARNP